MATKSAPLPHPHTSMARNRRHQPVEVTALIASRPLSVSELQRVSRVLAAEGLGDMRATQIVLTPNDTQTESDGNARPIAATIVRDTPTRPGRASNPAGALREALGAAGARGAAVKESLLSDPDMLSTAGIADRLGMSEEGIRLKRKRREILGLEFAKRGIRYPAWQILGDRQLLPGLPRLFDVLGGDPWRLFRFLQQHHNELGGIRALDALRHGRVNVVLAAAENTASGAFS